MHAGRALVLRVRVATLDHEPGDHAVEDGLVVEPRTREAQEVLHVFGRLVGEELDLDLAKRRLDDGSWRVVMSSCLLAFQHPEDSSTDVSAEPATLERTVDGVLKATVSRLQQELSRLLSPTERMETQRAVEPGLGGKEPSVPASGDSSKSLMASAGRFSR